MVTASIVFVRINLDGICSEPSVWHVKCSLNSTYYHYYFITRCIKRRVIQIEFDHSTNIC